MCKLEQLLARVETVGLDMKKHSMLVADVYPGGCLIDQACCLALEDGYSDRLSVDLARRWLGWSMGQMYSCGLFGSEMSAENAIKRLSRAIDMYAREELVRAGR